MYDEKKISTREELNIFFGRIHLYLPSEIKVAFFKPQKCKSRCPKCLKDLMNKTCDVMWG